MGTIKRLEISFDPAKSGHNKAERGLPFTLVARMEWSGAIIEEDIRKDYGERRFRALGFIENRLHAIAQSESTRGERL